MNENLKNKLLLLPQLPGCYLMKNRDGNIIYVGKAKKLKNRVRNKKRVPSGQRRCSFFISSFPRERTADVNNE